MKVRDLLTDESKWCKLDYARNKFGKGIDCDHPNACSWCLVGAIRKCYPDEHYDKVRMMYRLPVIQPSGVTGWNDAPERTFAEVRKLIEELDI